MIVDLAAAAAAAAKSLQSCPTLCDPIEGSPPGFPVPGILQARPLECRNKTEQIKASLTTENLGSSALRHGQGPKSGACREVLPAARTAEGPADGGRVWVDGRARGMKRGSVSRHGRHRWDGVGEAGSRA